MVVALAPRLGNAPRVEVADPLRRRRECLAHPRLESACALLDLLRAPDELVLADAHAVVALDGLDDRVVAAETHVFDDLEHALLDGGLLVPAPSLEPLEGGLEVARTRVEPP